MKRRDFILSAVAGVGIISISTYYFFGKVDYDNSIARPRFLSMIWDDEHINAIGKQYREQVPGESSERALAKLLKDIPATLDDRITNDFETGKTVVVDGWILSETEARQCALASTIQPE